MNFWDLVWKTVKVVSLGVLIAIAIAMLTMGALFGALIG